MLISVTEDVRVVLIKLAERTYALRELAQASRERQDEWRVRFSPFIHLGAPFGYRAAEMGMKTKCSAI